MVEIWTPARMAQELEILRAENERLRAENEVLRRWKALDKPLTAAIAIANSQLGPRCPNPKCPAHQIVRPA